MEDKNEITDGKVGRFASQQESNCHFIVVRYVAKNGRDSVHTLEVNVMNRMTCVAGRGEHRSNTLPNQFITRLQGQRCVKMVEFITITITNYFTT